MLISKLMVMGSNFWAVWPWFDLPFRHWPFSPKLSTGSIPTLRVIQYEVLQKTPPPFIYFFLDEAF